MKTGIGLILRWGSVQVVQSIMNGVYKLLFSFTGVWTNWTAKGVCSTTCGNGTQQWERTCVDDTTNEYQPWVKCEGDSTKTAICFLRKCPGKLILTHYIYWYSVVYFTLYHHFVIIQHLLCAMPLVLY